MSPLLYRVTSRIDGSRNAAAVADLVSADLGRTLTADQVRHLITAKLQPLGLLADQGSAAPPKARPLLALRARGTLLPEPPRTPSRVLLRPLFRWPVVVAVTVSLVGVDCWLFASHALGAGLRGDPEQPDRPAGRARPVRALRRVPRVRSRNRLPLQRRAARCDRCRHLPGLALVLHQRHRLLPARPGWQAAHRPRRRVLQRGLHPGPGRPLRGHLGPDPAAGHRDHPAGDAAAADPDRPL